MLKVRPEQWQVFRNYMREQFIARMVAELPQRAPAACADLGEEGLRELVSAQMDVAKTFGVTDETDVKRFLELRLRRGADFQERYAAVASVLQDGTLSGTRKMDKLDAWETFVAREQRPPR